MKSTKGAEGRERQGCGDDGGKGTGEPKRKGSTKFRMDEGGWPLEVSGSYLCAPNS